MDTNTHLLTHQINHNYKGKLTHICLLTTTELPY